MFGYVVKGKSGSGIPELPKIRMGVSMVVIGNYINLTLCDVMMMMMIGFYRIFGVFKLLKSNC